jgi:surface carbohydrate biosynthesis protein (TIGR04326 family)
MRIAAASFGLRKANHLFQPEGSVVDFWPLFAREWIDSLRGVGAIVSCLQVGCLERAVGRLPPQRLGIYIQENQPWEMALIHAWKVAGHGTLVGVPHTTVRYWDLRYFHDPRSYNRTGRNELPLPDRVAVNGPVAKRAYLDAGYPPDRLVEVEALRYLHLGRRLPERDAAPPENRQLNVLVCGDFLAATNRKMLAWLVEAVRLLPNRMVCRVKPHPAYPMDPDDLALSAVEVVEGPLSQLLIDTDVVFASNITSAAVDAYCQGLSVIQMLDGSTFNVSPLRGLAEVSYVSDARELAEALMNPQRPRRSTPVAYFYLEQSLPRWRELLQLSDANVQFAVAKEDEV